MFVLWTVFLAVLVIFLFKTDPKPILGVYTVPGKWYYLKYLVFLAIYSYRKWSTKHGRANSTSAGQGIPAFNKPEDLDRAQPLSGDKNACDAVFFISAKKGEGDKGIYVMAGCERRQMGICSCVFYIGLPGKGLLCSKKIPDTLLFGAEIGQFGAEGLLITPKEPMKRWTVTYKGQMWYQNDPEKLVDVNFEADWVASWKPFDYDTDLYAPAVVRSIAREPWSREYFDNLKKAHQSHYEQFGVMNAKFTIGDEQFDITLPSFRDHSFGERRDWAAMHRYAFHHIFLENNTSLCVGVICQPVTATNFEVGEVCLPNGDIHPVEWVDLQLYQHGEQGQAPRDYAFIFKAGDQIYTVQVLVEYESIHYKGMDWEARMCERFCSYVVNGTRGQGVSEFHYRHTDSRPLSIRSQDPQWYRNMCHEL